MPATLTLSSSKPAPTCDVLVVPVVARGKTVELAGPTTVLTVAARRRLIELLGDLKATGKRGEVVRVAGVPGAPVIAALGLGARGDGTWDAETLRRSAGEAARALAGTRRVAIAMPTSNAADVAAVGTGALLGAYSFTEYKGRTGKDVTKPVRSFSLIVDDPKDATLRATVHEVSVIAAAVHHARDLVNTPPGHLPPSALAEAAVAAGEGLPVTVEVLNEKELAAQGFGGILAVGQGSARAPRLIRIAYRPENAVAHLAFVGKGITFDTGGISIKPAAGMDAMKSDMAGAAAVIHAALAVAKLGLPVAITAYAPSAENMPSGTAQRPGDIITIYGGRTVEVLNTDAEGRLVLADALVRASEDAPDAIVDVATLTGAITIALGNRMSGVMSNNDGFRTHVLDAAAQAGEQMWPMPLPDDLRAGLDSPWADIANISDRFGGALTAGLFLKEFVPATIPWAHLDIAGPSHNEGGPYGYTPKGGTGEAVRTLVQLAKDAAAHAE
ncbi:MAG: leucyl aminopeptidase [Actinomycetes bacterium]